ncbi:hypothetical protein C4588_02140 [Candidatus Parcubacteria bacterium]|nr:MAG: hypothetical protein C4588_02140 [Candidatus Parcubacteria bacterium]
MIFEPFYNTHHKDEYRIPERDTQKTDKLTIPTNSVIRYTRRVHRVGYELDPYSYNKEEWAEAGLQLVTQLTQLPKEDVRKVIETLNLYHPYKGIKGRIYEVLVRNKIQNRERCLWFVDFQPEIFRKEGWVGTIRGRVRRWTGTWFPASGGYDDYEPGGLYPAYNQNLYQVCDVDRGHVHLVHPLDIQEVVWDSSKN